MIGQKNLIKYIDWMCKANCFPRFSIIVGQSGSEQIDVANHIAKQLECFVYELLDNKIDTIRAIIEESYKTHAPMLYIINHADDMSIPAKNSLLKVTEEPPNNAYFVMILEDLNNTLDTIRSRATIFTMEPYSKKELEQYAQNTYNDNHEIYTDLCETPGDIDLLYRMGALDFFAYVEKVVGNIGEVNGANSFKIADKIALKDEPDKYDLRMFWKACGHIFWTTSKSNDSLYVEGIEAIKVTSQALKKLSIRGVNKQMLFDEWLLRVREVLR